MENESSEETDDLWAAGLSPRAKQLALMACGLFGIDPRHDADPRELLALRTGGDPRFFEPIWITLVTGGGQKLLVYEDGSFDTDTTDRLRRIFGCYRTAADGRIEPTPLPADLTLPQPARDGVPPRPSTSFLGKPRDPALRPQRTSIRKRMA